MHKYLRTYFKLYSSLGSLNWQLLVVLYFMEIEGGRVGEELC